MRVMAVHQFAQCITCHAWSADQSSNYLRSLSIPILYFFSFWIPTEFSVSRENRVLETGNLLHESLFDGEANNHYVSSLDVFFNFNQEALGS
ncbi:hypothetical protein VNO80_29679 [Phaseolus coccineus]|uniref:Uncharacterized protein n=1 Tax=Phaseolus coccineus TaxID=3886 RepID=A0AAN9LBF8_PHACN